ncbi:MAG: hypothetical protein WBD40_20715 [Tepidisphaeraceae bacterium]
MKLACIGALAVLAMAPAFASAQHYHRGGYDRGARYYDRGTRYYGGNYDRGYRYDRGHRYDRGSRSNFDIAFGFGSGGYRDYSYVNLGYSTGYPRYYAPRPVYVAPPVYYAPVYRPVTTYCAPPVYYGGRSSYYYGGGYARPRAYYYSTGSYYCR